jgi:hypothetical protein
MQEQALARAAHDLAAAAGDARQWVADVQANAPRVASEALSLIETARRIESVAGKLERAATRRMCVGVFGPSQSGKSYLVSSLCKPPPDAAEGASAGREGMVAEFAGQELDFLKEINPPGGKESTGLVTRLSTQRRETPPGYPVPLLLLTETDLVRILANSYLSDFDANRLEFKVPGPNEVRDLLNELQKSAGSSVFAGHLDEKAIFELREYFLRNFPTRTSWLANEYWRFAEQGASRLSIADRARFFSVLWGGIEEFTQLYLRLAAALSELDFAPTAFAAMDAIQPRDRSIVDVDRIKLELGTPEDERALVKCLGVGPGVRREAALPRAVLCALIAEIQITLKNRTWPIFEQVDLLDFPGARSREKYSNIHDQLGEDDASDLARRPRELFIRGKVAVLFQRYTDELDLASLLLCMPEGTAEVKDLGLLLREWIFSTHGETPEERRAQRNALFVVLTKSDVEFVGKEGEDEESRRKKWYRRIFASMIELYQRDQWLDNWDGKPFSNTLWLRNPSIAQNQLVAYKTEMRGGLEVASEPRVEVGYASSIAGELPRLRDYFLEDRDVTRYFRDPARAFDALLTLNDGGAGYIVAQVSEACDRGVKLEQIRRRLLRQANLLIQPFGRFYDAGSLGSRDETLRRAMATVNAVGAAIRTEDGYRAFGHFIAALSAQESSFYELYLDVASLEGLEPGDAPAAPAAIPDVFAELEADGQAAAPKQSDRGTAATFARKAVQNWVRDMRQFAADEVDARRRRLDGDSAEYMVEQLIGTVHRLAVTDAIARGVGGLMTVSASWEIAAAQAACIAANRINDVVSFLGYGDRPPEERPPVPPAPRAALRRAFRPPDGFAVFPVLGEKAKPIATDFAIDWMAAFVQAALDNIGHAHGRDISPEQNAALGRIIERARLDSRLAAPA